MSGVGNPGWNAEEHVLAGPFAELLERACKEPFEVEFRTISRGRGQAGQRLANLGSGSGTFHTTSRTLWERRYSERYGTTERTAQRHFSLVFSQPAIPVYIADRISALFGVPMAYVEATAS